MVLLHIIDIYRHQFIASKCVVTAPVVRSCHKEPPTNTNLVSLLLQLARLAVDLDKGTAIAQADLASLHLSDETNLLPLALLLAGAPDVGDELVSRHDGAGKTGLVLLHVGRVAGSEGLEQVVAGRVP